uniref:Uncharacterized protein n=1 Tax=viral metagenome TaxID=1070528 RepID=A0A6C0EGB3_9ZZZZ
MYQLDYKKDIHIKNDLRFYLLNISMCDINIIDFLDKYSLTKEVKQRDLKELTKYKLRMQYYENKNRDEYEYNKSLYIQLCNCIYNEFTESNIIV